MTNTAHEIQLEQMLNRVSSIQLISIKNNLFELYNSKHATSTDKQLNIANATEINNQTIN